MNQKSKIFIAVLFIIFMTSIVAAFGGILGGNDSTTQNVLICPVDNNGSCNVAFLVTVDKGSISGYTPVFTDGMTHPSQTNDAGEKLAFHDVFTLGDRQQALQYAKEIYEANNSVTVDAVASVDSQTISDVIAAAGTLKNGNKTITPSATDIINADPSAGVDAIKPICDALLNAAKNPQQRDAMLQAALGDFRAGDIAVYPRDFFKNFITSQALGGLFG